MFTSMTGANDPSGRKPKADRSEGGASSEMPGPGIDTPQGPFRVTGSILPRFESPEWESWPFNVIYRNFLLSQKWWNEALDSFEDVAPRERQKASIAAQQMFDMASPANALWSNPEVIAWTLSEGGANLLRGALNLIEDLHRAAWGLPPVGAMDYVPGCNVAVTPGKVVYRSDLLELIQYDAQTETVAPEPVLIVPAWLMKYYILDLSPQNSLVNYLCGQGFSVFMISWANPGPQDRDIGMADYLDALEDALAAVARIVPNTRTHAIGYCLGGMLLTVKAAQMARDRDDRLKSLTLFASQLDFTEHSSLQSLLGEPEVSLLESVMSNTGYLDGKHISDAYKVLRAGEWIWPHYINNYLMGRRYLRSMVLNNALAGGTYEVGGRPVSLGAITVPVFCVAAADDQIAPWQSVYRLRRLLRSDITFLLTSGGHVDGIINAPGCAGASYQVARMPRTAPDIARDRTPDIAPENWRHSTPSQDGSWWPEFAQWLHDHSGSAAKPPIARGLKTPAGTEIEAPGTYVFQK
ncbi:alpha/beta fold hydrolase [Thioclava indica]